MSVIDEQVRSAEREFLDRFEQGPEHDRWAELPPQVGDPAPDLRLLDSSRDERPLSELWGEGPALLLFWRHYGCSCGVGRAARLREELSAYVDAGANVAVIGQA